MARLGLAKFGIDSVPDMLEAVPAQPPRSCADQGYNLKGPGPLPS